MMGINQLTFIEKFRGKFDEVDGGCTVTHTRSLQLLKNPINLAIYVYLCSKPPGWKLNIKDIMNHFTLGKNKVYRAINDLLMTRLIDRKEIRSKGMFCEYQYFVHLSPLPENGDSEKLSTDRFPDNRFPVSPLPENGDTYIKETLPYKKESIKKGGNPTTSKPKVNPNPKIPSLGEYQDSAYWSKQPDYLIPKEMKLIIKKVSDWNSYNAMI